MAEYESEFTDAGKIRWLPYVMYFHPMNYRSSVINTDHIGARYSGHGNEKYSLGDNQEREVNVIAGSSTAFGIGSSSDDNTLASRMSAFDRTGTKWLNLGGRSYNSTQEIIFFMLHRHLLPKVDRIVLFSGFNDLGLARQPRSTALEHGAFFNSGVFFDALPSDVDTRRARTGLFSRKATPEYRASLTEQIELAAELTLRHLKTWSILAADLGAKLTFILQPLANWVRPIGCAEEQLIFDELDRYGGFTDTYGDILTSQAHDEYFAALRRGAAREQIDVVDFSPILADAARPEEWLFVDRIHFTDRGSDLAARLILETLAERTASCAS